MLFKSFIAAALVVIATVSGTTTSFAQTGPISLKVTKLEDVSILSKIIEDTRQVPADGIPDGRVDRVEQSLDIVEAWYSAPTTRYRHGALGDEIEAGTLKVRTRNGRILKRQLSGTEVFEDLTPRIVDLNNDGKMEVVTIRASRLFGAAITVYSMSGNSLIQRATTNFIGRPNRWLNIAGIGRFTGSRQREIAFVDRPHLRGELKYLRLDRRNQLLLITRASKFTNHINGSTEQRLSAVIDFDGDGIEEIVIPDFNRQRVSILELSRTGLRTLATANLPARLDKAIGTRIVDNKLEILVGLENGTVYALTR